MLDRHRDIAHQLAEILGQPVEARRRPCLPKPLGFHPSIGTSPLSNAAAPRQSVLADLRIDVDRAQHGRPPASTTGGAIPGSRRLRRDHDILRLARTCAPEAPERLRRLVPVVVSVMDNGVPGSAFYMVLLGVGPGARRERLDSVAEIHPGDGETVGQVQVPDVRDADRLGCGFSAGADSSAARSRARPNGCARNVVYCERNAGGIRPRVLVVRARRESRRRPPRSTRAQRPARGDSPSATVPPKQLHVPGSWTSPAVLAEQDVRPCGTGRPREAARSSA